MTRSEVIGKLYALLAEKFVEELRSGRKLIEVDVEIGNVFVQMERLGFNPDEANELIKLQMSEFANLETATA